MSERADGRHLLLIGGDDGPGLSPEQVERVFERFYRADSARTRRTDRKATGTGLGLAQVFGTAKQLGGEVTVDSRVGEGTRVALYLPRAAMGVAQAVTGGLFTSPLSRDQLALLRKDNVVTPGARGFADLGIVPTAAGSVMDDYLVRFRPSGQYDSIKRSAKNLRTP